jgi:hypothetical protein
MLSFFPSSCARYFVFTDDIQSKHAWSIINCALPNNNLGSRILATTCVKDVAMSCSVLVAKPEEEGGGGATL